MGKQKKILIIENDIYDIELIQTSIKGELNDIEFMVCDDMPGIKEMLAGEIPDIILSDYNLGGFTGMEAFKLIKEKLPEVPFILVTGAMGEEEAVDKIKSGVTDFVLKDHLSRLVPAVKRAFHEVEEAEKTRAIETEKNRIMDELRHMQRLDLLGTFTAQVTHDFRNFITAIMSSAELIKLKSSSDEITRLASFITNSSERALELIGKLLVFSRKGEWKPAIINIDELIEETIPFLESICGKGIKINFTHNSGTNTIEADKAGIVQLLANIASNAKDAMSSAGSIIINRENVSSSEIGAIAASSGYHEFIKISIKDTGPGFETEIIPKIFEPFFTTKSEGVGTGLGLAMVYGIIKKHNGFIKAENDPEGGAVFYIYLPCYS